MSEHTALIQWHVGTGDFLAHRYSRAHTWTFDGGITVPASSSPSVVPLPYSDPTRVDPEEAFVASIASCHMLWFLSLAAERGLLVERYTDNAAGRLTTDADGRAWISTVILRPVVRYAMQPPPSQADEDALHHAVHEACFIANSVRTRIIVQRGETEPAAT